MGLSNFGNIELHDDNLGRFTNAHGPKIAENIEFQTTCTRSGSTVALLQPTRQHRKRTIVNAKKPKMHDDEKSVFVYQPSCLCPNSCENNDARQMRMMDQETRQPARVDSHSAEPLLAFWSALCGNDLDDLVLVGVEVRSDEESEVKKTSQIWELSRWAKQSSRNTVSRWSTSTWPNKVASTSRCDVLGPWFDPSVREGSQISLHAEGSR